MRNNVTVEFGMLDIECGEIEGVLAPAPSTVYCLGLALN